MSAQPAIGVERIGKEFQIGVRQERYKTLRESLSGAVVNPVRSLLSRGAHRAAKTESMWALKDVSFEIQQGEIVGIVGGNGAGKSTLLKVLSRITEPSTGKAEIYGRIGSLLEVGTGFHPELTGRENIFLNGAILGMKRVEIDRRFDEIVAFSEVDKFLDTAVKHYSSGMYLRLAFAVAAHLDPEILLVDEVLAVGDAAFQKKCLGKMSDVANTGRTILFVSHNMAAIQALTHRCIYLKQGRVEADGSPGDVIQTYLRTQKSAQAFDASTVPRISPHHGTQIRIVAVQPSFAHQDHHFVYSQPMQFMIDVDSKIAASGLRFGMTLNDMMGTPVMTMFTPQNILLAAGKVTRNIVTIQNSRLAPGMYTLHVSIGEGGSHTSRQEFDIVKRGPDFSIEAIAIDGAVLYNWNKDTYGPIVHSDVTVTTDALAAVHT